MSSRQGWKTHGKTRPVYTTRRTSRRLLFNFVCFSTILLIVVYLNRPRSKRPYAWGKVRYISDGYDPHEGHGVCPGLAHSSKPALVVSRVTEDGDTGWLDDLRDSYHLCVYTVNETRRKPHLQVPANRGHEAMAYLTFLIDNYDEVPAAGAVFIHGQRFAWHNDHPEYDNAALLRALDVSRALKPQGYHNLRCDWSASTCDANTSPPQGSLETSMRAMTEPWNDRVVSDGLLPHSLVAVFGGDDAGSGTESPPLARRDAVRSQCCAQFVVSRDRILSHSKAEYVALRRWLLDGIGDGGEKRKKSGRANIAPENDRVAGRILSYVWHILFLRDSVGGSSGGLDLDVLNGLACPSAQECYCRLYGRCDLKDCRVGSCRGQYKVPPNFKLAVD